MDPVFFYGYGAKDWFHWVYRGFVNWLLISGHFWMVKTLPDFLGMMYIFQKVVEMLVLGEQKFHTFSAGV